MTSHHALFDTPLGPCGIAWSDRGIVRLQLPEASRTATLARLVEGRDGRAASPPAWVKDAARRIAAHLGGAPDDLGDLRLDLRGVPPFHQKVYRAARRLRPGETTSYGELARRVGSPGAARAVGQALAKNPVALIIPCHRVLAASGRPGGFSAWGGYETKARLLGIEGGELAR